ncbi:MAG: hypothetical protein ABL908_06575 [Hyphomicrobium sp.]
MNRDGLVTISDIWPAAKAAYHWPGDKLLELIAHNFHGLSTFLELSSWSCGGWLSFGISTLVWLIVLIIIGMIDGL